jgi:Fe-Mn family superoxide dismutase
MIVGTPYEHMDLEGIVKKSAGNDKEKGIFNNAGQIWNHNFYWESMAPKGGAPAGKIADAIKSSFGGIKEFNEAFQKAAVGQFGSGWAWLIDKNGKLEVVATSNADTPMAHGARCLLTLDVWEHAYYVDYRNQREKYVQAVIEKRLNWEFAEQNLNRR